VPIVEPEVLLDGDHTIDRCFEVTEAVQHAVFHALLRHRVELEYIVLKPSMIVPGKDAQRRANPEEIAEKPLHNCGVQSLRQCLGFNFLSGDKRRGSHKQILMAMNAMAAMRRGN